MENNKDRESIFTKRLKILVENLESEVKELEELRELIKKELNINE